VAPLAIVIVTLAQAREAAYLSGRLSGRHGNTERTATLWQFTEQTPPDELPGSG
jgi:hypothetical protein